MTLSPTRRSSDLTARSGRRPGAQAREADAAPGAPRGRSRGSRTDARDRRRPLWTAHTLARLLEAIPGAAPVAGPRQRLGTRAGIHRLDAAKLVRREPAPQRRQNHEPDEARC